LVIEDDPSLGEIYRKAITSADYDVDAADNLATARGYLSTKHYDVVVCDVHIGDDRATHLLREFAETLIGSGSQIMMVSGEPQYQAVCQEIGADLFMVKPVAISTLLSLINRLTAHPMTQRDG
jgi:DNA-binding response OmpR family regulator